MRFPIQFVAAGAVFAGAIGAGASAVAAEYPERPVTVVVPFSAGGPTDAIARVLASTIEPEAGQPFVVENRSGAGSTLGTASVAESDPDGYTLLLGSSSGMVIAPHLYSDLRYDPLTSFEPLGMVASTPYVLMVNADSPFQNFEELVDYARENPGELNYATPGAGTSLHLTLELMAGESGISAVHIPFRGGAPAMNALLAGDVDYLIDVPSAALPRVEAGSTRALAVTSPERIDAMPDVPTLHELGLEGFDTSAWFALFAPTGTPEPTLVTLRELLAQAQQDPKVKDILAKTGFQEAPVGADHLAETVAAEYARWGAVIDEKGIEIE